MGKSNEKMLAQTYIARLCGGTQMNPKQIQQRIEYVPVWESFVDKKYTIE